MQVHPVKVFKSPKRPTRDDIEKSQELFASLEKHQRFLAFIVSKRLVEAHLSPNWPLLGPRGEFSSIAIQVAEDQKDERIKYDGDYVEIFVNHDYMTLIASSLEKIVSDEIDKIIETLEEIGFEV